MDVTIVKKVVASLASGPKPINQLARETGIGWKTCEKYLESLKLLGQVEELVTPKERVFSIRAPRSGWLFPHTSRIQGNKVEWVDEIPP